MIFPQKVVGVGAAICPLHQHQSHVSWPPLLADLLPPICDFDNTVHFIKESKNIFGCNLMTVFYIICIARDLIFLFLTPT